jgi:hypothetical protein
VRDLTLRPPADPPPRVAPLINHFHEASGLRPRRRFAVWCGTPAHPSDVAGPGLRQLEGNPRGTPEMHALLYDPARRQIGRHHFLLCPLPRTSCWHAAPQLF